MQSTLTKPQGKFSNIIQLYYKAKFVFLDCTILKKGKYIVVYPFEKVYTASRFFNYYPDKTIQVDRVEYDGIPTVYINDFLLIDFS